MKNSLLLTFALLILACFVALPTNAASKTAASSHATKQVRSTTNLTQGFGTKKHHISSRGYHHSRTHSSKTVHSSGRSHLHRGHKK